MSTWGKITSNAAKFWDGFGDGLDNITKPIDDFIDFITQPHNEKSNFESSQAQLAKLYQ